MDNLNIRLSEHARDVMRRRGITFDEIAEIIARPQIRETTAGYSGDAQHYRYVVGKLAVVVAEERSRKNHIYRTVVTVLLREGNAWTDREVAGR